LTDPVRQDGESLSDFATRIKEYREAQEPKAVEFDPRVVPNLPERPKSTDQLEMDAVLSSIDIVQAYQRWCNKMEPRVGNKTESIMVSCPNPAHPDRNPSAWLTLNKGDGGVGNCATCGGFDKYDIAAYFFGFNVPGYKDRDQFPNLRRMMAEALGYVVMQSGKDLWLERIDPVAAAEDEALAATVPDAPTDANTNNTTAPVVRVTVDGQTVAVLETWTSPALTPVCDATNSEPVDSSDVGGGVIREEPRVAAVDGNLEPEPTDGVQTTPDITFSEDADLGGPGFDWRTLGTLTPGTFMHEWMKQTSPLPHPEEYYFFCGLQVMGAAVGNKVVLSDFQAVRPNLIICLTGATSTGKSTAMGYMRNLLRRAFPWSPTDGTGVRTLDGLGSGEVMIDSFAHEVTDPVDPTKKTLVPINGYIEEDELEGLMAKANRANALYRTNLMKLFDSTMAVEARSRQHGAVYAQNHYMQLGTTVQPKRLSAILSKGDASSGFVNRFVFVFGTPKFRPTFISYRPNFDEAVELAQKLRAWAAPGRQVQIIDSQGVPMDPDAVAAWDVLVQTRIRPLEETEGPSSGRVELHCKKLMLLLAINQKMTIITKEHIADLSKLMDYLFGSFEVVDRNVGLTEVQECCDAILKYMTEHPTEPVTFRVLSKSSGAKSFDQYTRSRAMELLVGKDIVESPKKAGDRVVRYELMGDTPTPLATVTPIVKGVPFS
jgi:uncharacterized protein DUF3987